MTQADVTVAVFWLFGRAKRPRFLRSASAAGGSTNWRSGLQATSGVSGDNAGAGNADGPACLS